MVHVCVVCGKVDNLNRNLSFHRFPQDSEKRKMWFFLVGILDHQPLRKNPELCSDHFLSEDILVRANGAQYIKKGANPRRCEGLIFLDDVSNSSESTVFGKPPAQKEPLAISQLSLDGVIFKSDEADRDEKPSEIINSPNIEMFKNTVPNLISLPGTSGYGATQGDVSDENDEDTKIDIKQEFDPDIAGTSASHNGGGGSEEPTPPKRVKMDEYHYRHYNDNTAILHLLSEIRNLAKERDNPIATFFESMAKTVMQFPPAQAAEVKLKVCQIVTEMECKILEESGNYPDNLESFD